METSQTQPIHGSNPVVHGSNLNWVQDVVLFGWYPLVILEFELKTVQKKT